MFDTTAILGHAISALIGGTVGAVIAAAITQRESVKKLMGVVSYEVERIANPVHEFRDLNTLAGMIRESIESYEGDYSRLVLLRALPCELSDELINHCEGHPAVITETNRNLQDYHSLIDKIIREGVGAYDKSVFGATGRQALDRATYREISKSYFMNSTAPDTTEIGFHDNLNEFGLILFGDTEDKNSDKPYQWRVGYLIYFPRDFSQCRGFRYRLHSHIDNMSMVIRQKQMDAEALGMYFSLHKGMSRKEIDDIRQFFASHLESPEECVPAKNGTRYA